MITFPTRRQSELFLTNRCFIGKKTLENQTMHIKVIFCVKVHLLFIFMTIIMIYFTIYLAVYINPPGQICNYT